MTGGKASGYRLPASGGALSFRVLPWSAIVVVALGLRFVGLRYGLPAVYNPDEVAIMSRALAFAKGDLNPHNFLYPSFYFYALFAWEGMTALLAVATRTVASLGAFQREFFLDPTRVFVAGRLFTALLGTATVVVTGVFATRVAGRFVGFVAAILLAVAPLHVLNSHYVKHDVPVTFLIVLAYLAYDHLWARADLRSTAVAAAVTGVAFSTHYYAIFLAIPLAWSSVRGARDSREAILRLAIAGLVSAAVFFLFSPFILVEPGTALRDIRANRQIVVDRAVENLGYFASAARYATLMLLDTAGLPTALLALAGVMVSARRAPARTLWLLAFPVPFLLFIFSTYPASRYLVAVTPFIALFAAVAIGAVWQRKAFAGVALLLVAVGVAAVESARTGFFMRRTDTRTLAMNYIHAHVPPGTTILTQPYSVPLEPTADSLREAVQRTRRDMPTKTALQIARDPYPALAYRLIYLGRGLDADKLYLAYDKLGGNEALNAARAEHVAFVVVKRYNASDPATLPFLTALAREGRRIAVFTPYKDAPAVVEDRVRPEPFLHNTDARIEGALERPGPIVEIWQLDGPGL